MEEVIKTLNKSGNIFLEMGYRFCWFIADTARDNHQVNVLYGGNYGFFDRAVLIRQWGEEEKIREQERELILRRLRNGVH